MIWALAAVGATIYFGSEESTRQLVEVAEAFQSAHELGLGTVLWCLYKKSCIQERQRLSCIC